MIVLAMQPRQWGFEVGASLLKQQPQAVDRVSVQDAVSILGDEDQVDMPEKHNACHD